MIIGLIKRNDKICSFMSFKIEFEESQTFSFVLQYFIAFHIVFNYKIILFNINMSCIFFIIFLIKNEINRSKKTTVGFATYVDEIGKDLFNIE